MLALERGAYRARLADRQDQPGVQALRDRAFGARIGPGARDADEFDARCRHIVVEHRATGGLMCCFRVMQIAAGADIGRCYSAQSYDLSRLAEFPEPMIEIGRFCTAPEAHDPDVLRLAWGAITRLVDAWGAGLLFGCSSFDGADPTRHAPALSRLRASLAPSRWMPGRKAAETVDFALPVAGTAALPPLLRTYLAMGGWVSDHAVLDRALNTLHVFTGLEIAAIPPVRARALRAIAQ